MARRKPRKSNRRFYGRLVLVLSFIFLILGVWFQFFWENTASSPAFLPLIQGCPKPWRTRAPQQDEKPQAHIYNDLNRLGSPQSKFESLLLPTEKPLPPKESDISEPRAPSSQKKSSPQSTVSIDDLLEQSEKASKKGSSL